MTLENGGQIASASIAQALGRGGDVHLNIGGSLTISSAGKTFSFTGWKIGWVCGPDELVTAVRTAKQFLTYANGAPFQPAIAVGLGLGDDFYLQLATTLQAKRDVLCDGLRAAGFEVFVPQGTYFATVDIRSVGGDDGLEFCRVAPGALWGGGRPELGLLRGPGHRSPPRALRLLQAHRGPHRGGRAARTAQPGADRASRDAVPEVSPQGPRGRRSGAPTRS